MELNLGRRLRRPGPLPGSNKTFVQFSCTLAPPERLHDSNIGAVNVRTDSWAEPCLEHLEEWGLTQTGTERDGMQDPLVMTAGDRHWVFQPAYARYLRTSTVAHRAAAILDSHAESGNDTSPLLFTEYVTPGIGEVLRGLGLCYVDVAGNAWIQNPGLRVSVEGKRRVGPPKTHPKSTTPAALQLVYLLLKDTEWCRRPYREMADHTGLALGSIGWIMHALIHTGHVARAKGGRSLKTPARLLTEWEEHWLDRLRPRLEPTVCMGKRDPGFARLLNSISREPGWFVGGELGAAQLLGDIEPTTATIHVPPGSVRECMRRLSVIPNREGNITLLETFGNETGWEGSARERVRPHTPPLADPLLLRAEILGSNDQRLRLMANELLTDFIEPRWDR